ncbi:hypothetical protein OEB99_06230 [Actinotalea sp. M2MS4P-6]|uniref:hypothetical protein n=1 Tax=Actinotalea sp. M2MS4P-6 TaxID=2983762 RepID=UPI0021E452BD|nr:hypothetical protein [Actinotalea sp. M2MS4P-6]MCV2393899.1 hypothetical protein [Actinotalea sp. M2MS4P-6]
MPEPLLIDLRTLRTAIVGALDACERQLGRRVQVEIDYYWHLPVDAAYDMTKEPSELTVGQLSDDLEEVSVVSGQPETAWHDLAHAIGVLRALEAALRP